MAISRFSTQNFLIRLCAAVVLVFTSYNPVEPYSYYEWALAPLFTTGSFNVFKAFVGLVLIIGWAIFVRATHRSLGAVGLVLAAAFFFLFFWLLIDQGWLTLDNTDVLSWLVLIAVSGIMAIGMSWSHIRRRMSGQFDVDETDDKVD